MSTFATVKVYRALLPFAALYRMGVGVRNFLFDRRILRSRSFPLPVICVGNLTVGGTGKTPHTEYLIRLLKDDCKVAVLSRGYKRKSSGFVLATPHTPIEQIGDEPYQMYHKFPDIYMAVDRDRCHGIEMLRDEHVAPGVEVVLLDDAFQHRYVKAGLNILLIDYHRPVFHDSLLPAGRLREPVKGTRRADVVIVSKCPSDMSEEEQQAWQCALSLSSQQQLYFSTLEYGALRPAYATGAERSLDRIGPDEHILLLTGIASPQPIMEMLSRHTRHITTVTFPDHHAFTDADLRRVAQDFQKIGGQRKFILTTEKDFARLADSPSIGRDLKPHLYVLPVAVKILQGKQDTFNHKIKEYVREDSRNSSLPKG